MQVVHSYSFPAGRYCILCKLRNHQALTSPALSSAYLPGLSELHKCLVLHPSCTESRGDNDYVDMMPLPSLELHLKRTMDARAQFTPGGLVLPLS